MEGQTSLDQTGQKSTAKGLQPEQGLPGHQGRKHMQLQSLNYRNFVKLNMYVHGFYTCLVFIFLLLASLAILFEHIVERTLYLEEIVFKKARNSQRGD